MSPKPLDDGGIIINKKEIKRGDPVSSGNILSLLAARDGFVSGAFLSRELNISRTAVWKKIAALKREGYQIEASTRKGYRLLSHKACYGKPGIQSLLKTEFFGRDMRFYESVESTNNVLKGLANAGAAHGTVVIANGQTRGRGRLGREWNSVAGKGIWMSVLLRPQLHPARVQAITLAAAVAVCRAIEPLLDKKPGIKWPNDILLGGGKVCGILTELSAEAERVSWVIAGIGLNTHFAPEDFSPDLKDKATSLIQHLKKGGSLDRTWLAAEILNQFEQVYEEYLENGPDSMLMEWRQRSVTLKRMVELVQGTERIRALALDIGEDGRLRIRLEDGSIREIFSGEISLSYD
ncbi:MAG: biotin--[acetyl-CoA-carboxylase] ligase [Clostridiaceae bacterium]|nr:biotin--[acetyl-CoA-carboxylase] ligase [Clostridiaceae bacterium]